MENIEKIILNASVEEINGKKTIEVAKKKGISVDNPSLAFFSSVLCEIENTNANKIRLEEEATYEAVDSLVGTQVNFNHIGKGNICGFIFDSFINKKKQVCISCVFFKKIYNIEYSHAKKLFAKGELTMSYELSADSDTIEKLSDGTRRIHDFYFTGAGLLIGETPACENAIVYEFAKKMENERQELIFAKKSNLKNLQPVKEKKITTLIESLVAQLNMEKNNMDLVATYNCECLKCGEIVASDKHCKDIKCPKCDGEMRRKDRPSKDVNSNETNEEGGKSIVKIDEIKAKLTEELGDLVKDWTDEDFSNDEKIAEARKVKAEQASVESEETDEEAKEVEEKAEKTDEEAKEVEEKAEKTVVEVEEKVNTKSTYDDEDSSETKEVEYEIEVKRDGKVIRTEKSKNETVYMYAQVEAIKAEYENQINELKATLEVKDSEIEEVRANAETIAKLKIEHASNEFTKEFKDEDWLNAEKIEEAKNLQAKKEKIEANKTALKDNEYVKDFSDEDYANDDKVEKVKLQAKLKAEQEKIKALEAQIKPEEESEEVEAKKEEDLETNHTEEIEAKEKEESPLTRMLKNKINK